MKPYFRANDVPLWALGLELSAFGILEPSPPHLKSKPESLQPKPEVFGILKYGGLLPC